MSRAARPLAPFAPPAPRRLLGLLLLGLPLAACGSRPNVWLIEVDTSKGDGLACSQTVTENYVGDVVADNTADGPFTQTSSSAGSNFLFYVKLLDLGDGLGTLNSGELLLPGEETEDGWKFAWTESAVTDSELAHEAGYRYGDRERQEVTTRITLELDSSSTGTGRMAIEDLFERTRSESDTWSDEAIDALGNRGSLSWTTADGDENNGARSEDCDDTDCVITEAQRCAAAAPLTATRTALKDDDDFSSLVGLAAYGAFRTTGSFTWGGGGGDTGW